MIWMAFFVVYTLQSRDVIEYTMEVFMKVMIAAGGTGGHIHPALALADKIKSRNAENEVIFFGSLNRMEADVIPAHGYKFCGAKMSVTNGGPVQKAKAAASMVSAYGTCLKMMKQEKPDICIGFGNYISVPLITSAHKLHIPILLHEQNSFAGKANRFLAQYADGIVTCYKNNEQQFPKEKIRLLGNPEASAAADTTFDSSVLKEYGLNENLPFVVFMMGSLGSSSVSQVIDEACDLFDESFQVIIAKGKSNAYEFKHQSDGRIALVDYVDGKAMLKGCALAVTRAGATTICEIGAIGCASVLIPSPYVPDNHQYYNAMELVEQGAADIIEEKDLSAKSLADKINALMKDENSRINMKNKAYEMGRRDAADQMINWMEELVNG